LARYGQRLRVVDHYWTTERVCKEAHLLGAAATIRHFHSYVRWGLIRPREDGRWAPETVGLLVRIGDAARQARPLHRRVVVLRSDYFMFPVPNQLIREAMIALASASIEHPRRKMRADRPALERMGRGAWRTVALARCRPVARSSSPSGNAAARDVGRNPPRPEPHRRHLRSPPELRVRA
jgi:hypothetical protein